MENEDSNKDLKSDANTPSVGGTVVEYNNPTPVVACLIALEDDCGKINGYVAVVRDIEPKKGGKAFPGGYVDAFESAEEAAVRECKEEIGFCSVASDWVCCRTLTNDKNKMIIFVKHKTSQSFEFIKRNFVVNREVSSVVKVVDAEELAFNLHARVFKECCSE